MLLAIDKIFDTALCALAFAASVIITLSLVLMIALRFFFDISIMGMHEASLLAAIWLYMTGAILVMRRREHLLIDVLHETLSTRKLKAWHSLFISVLTLVITLYFSHWAWNMMQWGFSRPQSIPVLNLPLWSAQLPIAIAAIAAVVYAIRDIVSSSVAIITTHRGS